MFSPIRNLYTVAEVRALDKVAIDEFGIPGEELMQRAGAAAFAALKEHWPKARKIALFCGNGNNGGDGHVVATLARQDGLQVEIVTDYATPLDADVIVDALLGTGLKGALKSHYRDAICAINNSKLPVLAIDIPSGLNADTGMVADIAVKADVTVTFVGCKQGFFTGIAPDYCGKVLFASLDIPSEASKKISSSAKVITPLHLAPRQRSSHKGDFGHVLVIGGDYGMAGAVRMAAEGALRTGAGLTTVATRKEHVTAIVAGRPELMCYGVENGAQLKPLLERATVIVIGPGLGQSSWGKEMFQEVIKTEKPLLIDADGLNLLAYREPLQKPLQTSPCQGRLKRSAPPDKGELEGVFLILTPHPGEAARLLNCSTKEIQQDRFAAVTKLWDCYNAVCVLKGVGTLVASANKKIQVALNGNPGMAKGGMGDILSGIIAGLVAQGLNLHDAATYGVYLHGAAADLAVTKTGEQSLLASDVLQYLGDVL